MGLVITRSLVRYVILFVILSMALIFISCGTKKESVATGPSTDFSQGIEWNPGASPPVGPACSALAAPAGTDADADGLCNAFDASPSNPDANNNGVVDGLDPDEIKKGKKKGGGSDDDDGFWDVASPLLGLYAGGVGLAYINSAFLQDQACLSQGLVTCAIVHPDYESFAMTFGTNGVVEIVFDAQVEKEYLLLWGLNATALDEDDVIPAQGRMRAQYNIVSTTETTGGQASSVIQIVFPEGSCNNTPDFFGAKMAFGGDEHCVDVAALFGEDSLANSFDADSPKTEADSFSGFFRATFNGPVSNATQMNLVKLDSVEGGSFVVSEDKPGDTFASGTLYEREGEAASETQPIIGGVWGYHPDQMVQFEIEAEAITEAMQAAAIGDPGTNAPTIVTVNDCINLAGSDGVETMIDNAVCSDHIDACLDFSGADPFCNQLLNLVAF